ncbi:MAG TPA: small basic family protein [Fimbriimonadaceae bacterium]|nr:small basic family protein [Fimbriimonadaceae bacterium]
MFLIPLLALIVGVLVGIKTAVPVSGIVGIYLGVAVIAGIDSVFGGWRSALEGKFRNDVFVTGFVSNVLIAAFLAWLGDHLGINLFLAAALVMGWRIFTNLSIIRRIGIERWKEARAARE